jgi:putative endonuclease
MWVLYILSLDNKYLYTGITNDLENRLRQHKNGQSKFTKRFKEIELIYTENFETKTEAVKREREIKGWSRKKKIEKLGLPSS